MGTDRITRRLAAILIADVAGYSGLMERDEAGTHRRLSTVQAEIVTPSIVRNDGRTIRLTGDGMLAEFPSATDALRCAIEIQRKMGDRAEIDLAADRISFRIGVNVADILFDGRDIAGGGVNLAARLETLAYPGGICISQALKEQIHEDLGVNYVDAGTRSVKNISRPVHFFRVQLGPSSPAMLLRNFASRVAASAALQQIVSLAYVTLVAILSTLLWLKPTQAEQREASRISVLSNQASMLATRTVRMTGGTELRITFALSTSDDLAPIGNARRLDAVRITAPPCADGSSDVCFLVRR